MDYPTFGYPDISSDMTCNEIIHSQVNENAGDPLNKEIGGEHYKSSYQPVVLMENVRMYACCANILKYVFRHRNKNGKQDLEKALHYCDLLVSLGSNWYQGNAMSYGDMDTSKDEFYKFIKANEQLDKNQIRAITSIAYKDMEALKKSIKAEVDEFYS